MLCFDWDAPESLATLERGVTPLQRRLANRGSKQRKRRASQHLCFTDRVNRPEGYVDRWIVHGKVDCHQYFTANELTVDEYFFSEAGAKAGVTFENTSETEPLVTQRYSGPEANPDAPAMGAYRKNKFN